MTLSLPVWVILFVLLFSPSMVERKSPVFFYTQERSPAEIGNASDCNSLVKELFISKNYETNHNAALIDKKLISFTNKFVSIQHPRMDWMNRVRKSLNQSLRNWNNNRYPSFYLFNDEEIIPAARNYFTAMEKTITEQLPLTEEQTKTTQLVSAWIKSYQDYHTELDKLLDERISLQYNLSLLKKLKLKEEIKDIKLIVKRDGIMTEEIITLRKEDKNLGHLIKRFKSEIAELDGTLLRNGKIKERIIRQAMLNDILTIVHRELEYSIKNTPDAHEGLLKELHSLEKLVKNEELRPTTYGVYRVTNKVFIKEVLAMSKLDVLYTKIKDPVVSIKNLFVDFLKNRGGRPQIDEKEKIGFFKRIYNKVTSITPKQAAYGTGGAAVLAFGYHQYFWVNKANVSEENKMTEEQLDPVHQEQLERTFQEDLKKSESHSQVIELSIDELTKEVSRVHQ